MQRRRLMEQIRIGNGFLFGSIDLQRILYLDANFQFGECQTEIVFVALYRPKRHRELKINGENR